MIQAGRLDWQFILRWAKVVALIVLVAVNLLALVAKAAQVAHIGLIPAVNTVGFDWTVNSTASRVVVGGGDPFRDPAFVWTPVAALVFSPVWLLGWHVWQVAHIGAALAMPNWRLRLLVLLAFPFWWDVELGNILVFVLLAAVWAVRGNPVAIGAFLVLSVLVPRPLVAPIALWLLWKYPQWRLPFAGMVVIAVVGSAAMGLLGPFIATSLEAGASLDHGYNFAPSRLIGSAWLLVAVPAAVWLFRKGQLGLASVFASPYWLPYYLLLGLVDADRRRRAPVDIPPDSVVNVPEQSVSTAPR